MSFSNNRNLKYFPVTTSCAIFYHLFLFLNTFPVPIPSAHQVPVPETRLSLSFSHTSIISDPFLSDPLLSALQPYCLHSSVMRWSSSTRCLLPAPPNPSVRVEVPAHVNVDRCKWSFASRFVWYGRVDFITKWSAGEDTWEARDTERRMQKALRNWIS